MACAGEQSSSPAPTAQPTAMAILAPTAVAPSSVAPVVPTVRPSTPTATAEPETAVEPVTIPGDAAAKLDEYVSAYAELGFFSGSVLVAQGDNVLISKGYGMADYEQGIPNTPQTKFEIVGLTEQFTAMVILQLRECWLSAETGQIVNRDFELISRAL